jgi:tetratricopeptide (TPR) repeat protein
MSASVTLNLPDLVRHALTLHQSGRLLDAETEYRRILKIDPQQFEALHFLGLIEAQRQNFEEADRLMSRSLKINARTADAFANHARVLNALKRPKDALAACERALVLNPRLPSALVSRGNAFLECNRYQQALESYDGALTITPNNGAVWANRGKVLLALRRQDDAAASYQNALKLSPDLPEALIGHGNAMRELERYEDALASYSRLLSGTPDHVEVLISRAQVLGLLRRFSEALEDCARALAIMPENVSALVTFGDALIAIGRPEEALAYFDRALALQPDHVIALNNRTIALQALDRHQEALIYLGRAQDLAPQYADAHLNEALVRLYLGDFPTGWTKYEWRWKCKYWPEKPRTFARPLWLGQRSLEGRRILLHAEQGLGDTIQFMRYAPLVAALGARVVLEVQPPLKVLALEMNEIECVVGRGEPLPECDFHCPLLSLPLAFGTDLANVPARVRYLAAPPGRTELWTGRLRRRASLRVGLAWSGNRGHARDAGRSLSLAQLEPVLELANIEFVSLQKDIRDHDIVALSRFPQIVNPAPEFRDFGDTAAVISQLDIVIAVDTAVAHLAGALGTTLWMALPFSGDWRWMQDRNDSPWYPSARLFRQARPGDWDGVMAELVRSLRAVVEEAGK